MSSLCFPSPTPLATPSFYCLHHFAFLECHLVGIMQWINFSDWLPLLSNMHLSFLYVFSWLHFSLALNSILLSGYYYTVYPFTYWRTSWWLSNLSSYEWHCYKTPCSDFYVHISFQLLWVKMKENDCSIMWYKHN